MASLAEIASKLKRATVMADEGTDIRVIRAEIDDARQMLEERERQMQDFPLMCECELKGTEGEHTKTTRQVAEQAYINYRRYFPNKLELDTIGNRGGFGCVEIRMLLKGLNPVMGENGRSSKRIAFAKQFPDIKL